MHFRADIANCENDRDKVLSVCQCGDDGEIEYEVIIQRGPKEFDVFDDVPGPRITCNELGLDLVPGPERILFSDNLLIIVLSDSTNIEVDISSLTEEEIQDLRTVAKAIFE
jgi:hypothetical protein